MGLGGAGTRRLRRDTPGAGLKILFVTHTRIGDAVLSSGLLRHLVDRYPNAHFTIACGPLAASLFAATPRLERIILVAKKPFDLHWLSLWKELRGTVWDIVVDLRRSALAYLIPVRARYIVGPIAPGIHHVEHLRALLPEAEAAAPSLFVTDHHRARAALLIPDGAPVLAIAPVAATEAKTWPPERFSVLVSQLTGDGGPCAGWRIALFGGPGDEVRAAPLVSAMGRECIKIFSEMDLLSVYAALGRCGAFIGNDSGLSHLAAAAGIPVLALFGPTDPARYGPWGGRTVQAADGAISNLSVDDVATAFGNLLKSR